MDSKTFTTLEEGRGVLNCNFCKGFYVPLVLRTNRKFCTETCRKTAGTKRFRIGNRTKYLARKRVEKALEYGKLKKEPCEVCREKDVHAHHDDYEKPLDVRWMCRVHHQEHHASL